MIDRENDNPLYYDRALRFHDMFLGCCIEDVKRTSDNPAPIRPVKRGIDVPCFYHPSWDGNPDVTDLIQDIAFAPSNRHALIVPRRFQPSVLKTPFAKNEYIERARHSFLFSMASLAQNQQEGRSNFWTGTARLERIACCPQSLQRHVLWANIR